MNSELSVRRPHAYLHEISFAFLGFVLPLGAQTALPLLASPATKAAALGVASMTSLLSLAFLPAVPALAKPAAKVLRVWWLYVLVLALATFTRDLPGERYQLFTALPVVLVGFYVTERFRPGGWIRILTWVGFAHLILAITTNQKVSAFGGGVSRLEGATSAVLLGFESVLLIIIMCMYMQRGLRKMFCFPLLAIAFYALFASFSRSAFISLILAALLVFIFFKPRGVGLRVFFGSVIGFVCLQWILPPLVDFLAAGKIDSLTGASGRYDIWGESLSLFDQWVRGYGFAAMSSPSGPDSAVYTQTGGLPLESSLLQSLFMGGALALALWVIAFVTTVYILYQTKSMSWGLGLAYAAPLVVAAVYSIGLSGASSDCWWLLGGLSVPALLRNSESSSLMVSRPMYSFDWSMTDVLGSNRR